MATDEPLPHASRRRSVPVVQRCLRYSTAQIGSMAHVRPCIAASSSETELASDRSIDRIHDSSLEGRSPRAIHVAAADTETQRQGGDLRLRSAAALVVQNTDLLWHAVMQSPQEQELELLWPHASAQHTSSAFDHSVAFAETKPLGRGEAIGRARAAVEAWSEAGRQAGKASDAVRRVRNSDWVTTCICMAALWYCTEFMFPWPHPSIPWFGC